MPKIRQIAILEHVDEHGVIQTKLVYREEGQVVSRYEFDRQTPAIHKLINLLTGHDKE